MKAILTLLNSEQKEVVYELSSFGKVSEWLSFFEKSDNNFNNPITKIKISPDNFLGTIGEDGQAGQIATTTPGADTSSTITEGIVLPGSDIDEEGEDETKTPTSTDAIGLGQDKGLFTAFISGVSGAMNIASVIIIILILLLTFIFFFLFFRSRRKNTSFQGNPTN